MQTLDVFNSVSWLEYASIMAGMLILYYGVIFFRYFKTKDLRAYFRR